MAKTITNRTGASAPKNNEMPLSTADTPRNSVGGKATGAAMGGGRNDEHVQQHRVVGNPSSGRRMHSTTFQCYDAS
eukprot:1090357-Ditylum_brightwellii.AAC.1